MYPFWNANRALFQYVRYAATGAGQGAKQILTWVTCRVVWHGLTQVSEPFPQSTKNESGRGFKWVWAGCLLRIVWWFKSLKRRQTQMVVTAATRRAQGCWVLQFEGVGIVSNVSDCGFDVTSVSLKEEIWLMLLLLLVCFHLDCNFPIFHLLTGFCSWRCVRGFPLYHLETLWLHRRSFIT